MASNEDSNNNKPDEPEKPSCGQRMATSWHGFVQFLYNPKEHTVMGRTGRSWLAIIGFYIIFYGVLAAFWAACLAAFMKTIDFSQPTQQKMYSLLKNNPGMTYEPMATTSDTMVVFNSSDSSSYQKYVDRLNATLTPYQNLKKQFNAGNTTNVRRCDSTNNGSSNLNYVCLFDVDEMVGANSGCLAPTYGFDTQQPCVFLRPNKVFDWTPVDYPGNDPNSSTLSNPPASLFSGPSKWTPGHVAVTCEGENPVDQDNLISVKFYPETGFASYFYPYLFVDNYLPPFVMAKFSVVPGRVVMVWCRLWTAGIKHDLVDLQGSIHFELQVDH